MLEIEVALASRHVPVKLVCWGMVAHNRLVSIRHNYFRTNPLFKLKTAFPVSHTFQSSNSPNLKDALEARRVDRRGSKDILKSHVNECLELVQ